MERETDKNKLSSRLADRRLFSGEKTADYIAKTSRIDAVEKLETINTDSNITVLDVVRSLESKFNSWSIGGDQLDHT